MNVYFNICLIYYEDKRRKRWAIAGFTRFSSPPQNEAYFNLHSQSMCVPLFALAQILHLLESKDLIHLTLSCPCSQISHVFPKTVQKFRMKNACEMNAKNQSCH